MPSFDTQVPALLLRLDPNPFHHGTLGAVRSLGRTGIEVHLVTDSSRGPVARSRFLHRTHELPHGGAVSDAELEHALCRASEAVGRPAVLIPLDDRGAIAVAGLAQRLAGRFLLPAVAPDLPGQVADKAELAALCARAGVPHPKTVTPGDAAEAARAAEELGLPVVAKWSRPWLLPAGLRSTTLVHSPAECFALYERGARAGSRLLLQRKLPSGHGTDWFFHGYAAEDGTFLVGGSGRKERSWPRRTGLTAVGVWVANKEVEEAAARIAASVGYRGILDLDFRLDPGTGAYHLLDFNPRPGAQFRLFTDDGGLDVVRAQHLHLTGREVPARRGGHGRIFVAENYAALSALSALGEWATRGPRGAPSPRSVRRVQPRPDTVGSQDPAAQTGGAATRTGAGGAPGGDSAPRDRRRRVERAWYAADDPAPFFAMMRGWLARGARKACLRARGPRTSPAAVPSAAIPRPGDEPSVGGDTGGSTSRPGAPESPGNTSGPGAASTSGVPAGELVGRSVITRQAASRTAAKGVTFRESASSTSASSTSASSKSVSGK
jgi:predicted ATP-grasp superfamily ATP-dependent carboligase